MEDLIGDLVTSLSCRQLSIFSNTTDSAQCGSPCLFESYNVIYRLIVWVNTRLDVHFHCHDEEKKCNRTIVSNIFTLHLESNLFLLVQGAMRSIPV